MMMLGGHFVMVECCKYWGVKTSIASGNNSAFL